MRVLLVDDEKELVATLAERLSYRGIEADWAVSGDEALTIIQSQQYDIAVLDVKMPKMSGIRLKKELEAKCPKMKFIFLTGHGSEDDFKSGSLEAGEKNYLVKPINIQTLVDKINAVLSEQSPT